MPSDTAAPTDLDFDPEALRAKYRAERDKRLRADGNNQYREVTGAFAHYLEDPYVEPIVRDPVTTDCEVLVIGGGHGGLLIGARLREAGVESIRFIEKGGDFGGTWYWNRYPGAACDTEAYIYMPLLEETGYVPSEKYAKSPEIRAHCQRIGKHFDLYRDALFQTQITDLRWDEEAKKWQVSTDRGDKFAAKFVCMANGPLNRPKLPGVPGIETFKGHSFHTSRWDYEYTGGDSYGNLVGLADKRVAISTCSSARRRPWMSAPTGRRTRSGRSHSSPAGSATAWRTSPPCSPAGMRRRTWSATAGRRSSPSCCAAV